MEIDFVENVNGLDEHLVRLYNFDMDEAILFRDLLVETVLVNREKLDLSQVDFISSYDCNLIFGLFKSDEGILTKDYKTFYCILTQKGFMNMVDLIEPFCKKETRAHQYLYDVDTPIDLLFCPSAT